MMDDWLVSSKVGSIGSAIVGYSGLGGHTCSGDDENGAFVTNPISKETGLRFYIV